MNLQNASLLTVSKRVRECVRVCMCVLWVCLNRLHVISVWLRRVRV